MVDIDNNNPLNEKESIVCIYWDDLREEAQQELLDAFDIQSPKDLNWDEQLVPVAMVPVYP